MHITRKFWSPEFCGSYAPLNLEISWNLLMKQLVSATPLKLCVSWIKNIFFLFIEAWFYLLPKYIFYLLTTVGVTGGDIRFCRPAQTNFNYFYFYPYADENKFLEKLNITVMWYQKKSKFYHVWIFLLIKFSNNFIFVIKK